MLNQFDYGTAFSRNEGLISRVEQEKLRRTRVGIAGLGGVGGAHAMALARTGIGGFTMADPDCFEWANNNRQAGCMASTIGMKKIEVMRRIVRDINPDSDIRTYERIDLESIDDFLRSVDIAIDGLDFFACGARRLLYQEARKRGIPVVVAGPIGTSVIWQVFHPGGMAWEDFFGMDLAEDDLDRWTLFYLGNAPAMLHASSIDSSSLRIDEQRGPSLALAVNLCAGMATGEVIKLCLGRGRVWPAPYHQQYDTYTQKFRRTYLRWGLRGPLMRLRYSMLRRHIRKCMSKMHDSGHSRG